MRRRAIGFGWPGNLSLFESLCVGSHFKAAAFQNTNTDILGRQFASQRNSCGPGPDDTNVGVQDLALMQGVEIQDHSRVDASVAKCRSPEPIIFGKWLGLGGGGAVTKRYCVSPASG